MVYIYKELMHEIRLTRYNIGVIKQLMIYKIRYEMIINEGLWNA